MTVTGIPWAFIRSIRALSLNAETILTMSTAAKTAKPSAAAPSQNVRPMLPALAPRSEAM